MLRLTKKCGEPLAGSHDGVGDPALCGPSTDIYEFDGSADVAFAHALREHADATIITLRDGRIHVLRF